MATDYETIRAQLISRLSTAPAGIRRQVVGDREVDFFSPLELIRALRELNALLPTSTDRESTTTYADGGGF